MDRVASQVQPEGRLAFGSGGSRVIRTPNITACPTSQGAGKVKPIGPKRGRFRSSVARTPNPTINDIADCHHESQNGVHPPRGVGVVEDRLVF